MRMLLRWYPSNDAVDISYLRQIPGVVGIAGELVKPVGSIWPLDEIMELKTYVEKHNLTFEVVESVKVHEDIKLGNKQTRDKYIQNYIQTIRNLGKAGITVNCYDFMPIFDWFRTSTDYLLEDGSEAMAYDEEKIKKIDPLSDVIAMSDWEVIYSKTELEYLFKAYRSITVDDMWDNFYYFLQRIIPAAEDSGIKMALHPDDPSWSIFGLPRIITTEPNVDKALELYNSPYNSLTLCTGSLGCNETNDVVSMIRKYGTQDRIAFAHIRNVRNLGGGSFVESAHYSESGSLDIVRIIEAYLDTQPNVYVRPDHGRRIWGEEGAAGYGLYDRALGAMYMIGIEETLVKTNKD